MRRIFALVLTIILVLAVPSHAVTDYGASEVTRLWRGSDDAPLCSAAYILPRAGESISWIVSAGHCATHGPTHIKRTTTEHVSARVDWRFVALGDPRYTDGFFDLALGTAPDTRSSRRFLWLAERSPAPGEVVWIHGFPAMVERIIPAVVVERRGRVLVLATSPGEVLPGASGSPILNKDGYVVGILWGLQWPPEMSRDLVLATPVEDIWAAMAFLRVTGAPR